jgi:hypothetical protein
MFRSRSIVFAAVTAVVVSGQSATGQAQIQLSNYLDTTQMRISAQLLNEKQPADLVQRTLIQDRQIVEQSAGAISETFTALRYSPDEVVRGVGATWYAQRVGKKALPLTVPLTSRVLQVRAKDMGRLFVSSLPDQATVFVDQDRQGELTNAVTFPDVGQRRVRVEKAGLQPAETLCLIQRDIRHTFTATLLISGSTATCR